MNRNLALWIVVLTGPIVWLCSFEAIFALAPWACTFQSKLALYLVSLAAVIFCCASGVYSWRLLKEFGQEWDMEGAGAVPRGRAMAVAGLVLSAGFLIVVIAQAIPEIMLGACE
ncbi:MAG: hypothetical protein JO061_15590 [Acidobacteriaceae bacterium]|nr:hypothetical protein [Acidobacteriaceae bacterium]